MPLISPIYGLSRLSPFDYQPKPKKRKFKKRKPSKSHPAAQIPFQGKVSPQLPSESKPREQRTWKEKRADELRAHPTKAERWISKPLYRMGFRRSIALYGYIADFYHPGANVVVEIDGPYHATRLDLDRQRDAHLLKRGITTLRFSNDRVYRDLEAVQAEVWKFVESFYAIPDRRNAVEPGASERRALGPKGYRSHRINTSRDS